MAILKVARMGHPVLRAKARALDKAEIKSAATQKLIDDMIDTMVEYHGVGLAAPQVHESVRIFVAALDSADEGEEPEPVVLINPEIKPTGETVAGPEGCLSFPEIYAEITRPESVDVKALNQAGQPIAFRCGGRRSVDRPG